MNYFTHSAPRSWKPDSQCRAAIAQAAAHRPAWLMQRSGWQAGYQGLAQANFSTQFPGTGQLQQLKNLGHFQNPPQVCRHRV
jgi:hypothetical protein